MSVTVTVNPSWRIKTTPCEYYRKGRCIFGEDRCNFLHVMNDWNPDESTIIEPPKYLKDAPAVNIFPETPPSASLRSVRSPPRSPRTANLLLALKGAIVEDDDEEEGYIDDLSFEAVDDDDTPDTSGTAHPESKEHDESEHAPPSPTNSGLLSPVEFSDLQLKHLSLLQHSRSNSKSRDHKQSLSQDSSQWASPLHMARSPPRSPAPSSTFGLIASPFGSPSTRFVANSTLGIMSPRLGSFLPRAHVAPSPLASHFDVPGQEPQPEGPDVELDSPTNYYQEKKKAQEEENARVSLEDEDDNDDGHGDDDEDYSGPLTAIWDAEDTIRPFFLEPAPPPRSKFRPPVAGQYDDASGDIHKDVEEALRSRSASPLEYLQTPETVRQPPPFDVEDVQANSTFASEEDDEDETAQLGYLRGSPDEDDTINSLYDVYSDIESESEHSDEDEDEDEDVFISRPLPSRLSSPLDSSTSTSAVYSPSTALPHSNETFTPPRTAFASNFSPSTARVFTQPEHAPRISSSPSRSLASLPIVNEASNDQPMPLPFPGFSSSGRRESKLRPLRLSSIVTNYAPIPLIASSSSSSFSFAQPGSRPPADATSFPPPISNSSDRSSSVPRVHRSSIASTNVPPSASASSSEFALSNHASLSSTLSPPSIFPSQNQHGLQDSAIPVSSPLSAPLAVSSGQQSAPMSAMISPQRKSSIYYIRDELQPSPNELSSQDPPKSAPLAQAPTWEGKESIKSGSVRSFGTSAASRRVSRTRRSTQSHTRSQPPTPASPRVLSPAMSTGSLPIAQPTRVSENNPQSRNVSPPSMPRASPPTSLPSRPVTPKPTLLFAIASDNPEEVQRVLEHGDNDTHKPVDANDTIGPLAQTALEFTLENEGLKNKLGIVKKLLGYGADPSKVKPKEDESDAEDDLDFATKYYLDRADTTVTRRIDALMKRSVFRPLIRMRFGIIGQDRALEQLYRVLSIQSEKISKSPVVVFLCGPSGHGKSMVAHQFGALLEIPTHTVNMTTLRSADDLWRSYSISSNEDAPPCTLVEFLANNEGKRCVVVLDEIEKTERKALWSLLVPWELGRCTFEASSRTIDVRNVIWVGTSNIGNDLVLEYHQSRERPEELFTRDEYVGLMASLRPHVSDQLGASVLSRVSAILPFVPFTTEEKRALASEFLQESAAEELVQGLSKEQREHVVEQSLKDFVPAEGARSLYRAISNLLIDSMDL